MKPESGLGHAVVDLAGQLPYDVQRLAHEVWDDGRAEGTRARRSRPTAPTLRRLLAEHEVFFEATWQRLTLGQRGVLRALVLEEGRRSAVGRRALPVSSRRGLVGAGGAGRPAEAGRRRRATRIATSSSIR